MKIESNFSIIDATISAMRRQGESMLNITSGLAKAKTTAVDMVDTEDDKGAEAGAMSRGSLIDMDNVPVRMTNLNVAAHTYEVNVGVLGRYKQMMETTMELMG